MSRPKTPRIQWERWRKSGSFHIREGGIVGGRRNATWITAWARPSGEWEIHCEDGNVSKGKANHREGDPVDGLRWAKADAMTEARYRAREP